MFNLDVSKAIPRHLLTYLIAVIPGLFFEISILAANPELVAYHLRQFQSFFSVSSLLLIVVALFIAFIIGNAFMLLVVLIQYLLGFFHRFKLIFMEEFRRWPLIPFLGWLARFKFFAGRARFYSFRERLRRRASEPDKAARLAAQTWHRLARKLLSDRYGVDLNDVEQEWEFLFWSLGTPSDVEWRGPLLSIASEATGWCGFAATVFAPSLLNGYYLVLCGFFIFMGLLNDYFVAGRRTDPVAVAMGRTRALLREYEKDRKAQSGNNEWPEGPGMAEPS
jgi:hypothetical protein